MTGEQNDGTGGRLATAWAVVLPDGEQRLVWDLPFDLVAKVTRECGLPETHLIVDNPLVKWGAAAKLYRAAVKAAGQRPEPCDSVRDLRARFVETMAPAPADVQLDIIDELRAEWADRADEEDAADEILAEYHRRISSFQWAVVLPDGTERKLWDLEWALLEIVADRHGLSADQVLDRPRGGDGRVVADLWASITENQQQPSTTKDMSYAQVMDCFRLVADDKPALEDFDDGVPAPEADGPETD